MGIDSAAWLVDLQSVFESKGNGGGDLWYLLDTMVSEGKISFPSLIYDAANGYGCWVHEGLGYSLENDWDDPSEFDGVTLFIGEKESSALSVSDFVFLMKVACCSYVRNFPEDEERVFRNFSTIERRYSEPKGTE